MRPVSRLWNDRRKMRSFHDWKIILAVWSKYNATGKYRRSIVSGKSSSNSDEQPVILKEGWRRAYFQIANRHVLPSRHVSRSRNELLRQPWEHERSRCTNHGTTNFALMFQSRPQQHISVKRPDQDTAHQRSASQQKAPIHVPWFSSCQVGFEKLSQLW